MSDPLIPSPIHEHAALLLDPKAILSLDLTREYTVDCGKVTKGTKLTIVVLG